MRGRTEFLTFSCLKFTYVFIAFDLFSSRLTEVGFYYFFVLHYLFRYTFGNFSSFIYHTLAGFLRSTDNELNYFLT